MIFIKEYTLMISVGYRKKLNNYIWKKDLAFQKLKNYSISKMSLCKNKKFNKLCLYF